MEARKAWNPLYIGIISFFCLVLPAGILFAFNFEKLGKPKLRNPVLLGSVLYFLLLVISWVYLDKQYDFIPETAVLAYSIGMPLWQYPLFRKLRDDELIEAEALVKPTLLSLLFAVFVGMIIMGWNWRVHKVTGQKLLEAQEYYLEGRYTDSRNVLKRIIARDSFERTAWINLAITYNAMGDTDSATTVLGMWLQRSPQDGEARDMYENLRYSRGSE